MENWLIAVLAAVFAGGLVLVIAGKRRQDREALRVRRLRGSRLYREMASEVGRVRRRPLDQVLVEKDQVIFRAMRPPEVISRFSFSEQSMRNMNYDRLKTLVQLLGEEIPELSDPKRYRLRSYRVMRPSGEYDKAWEYVARPSYKSYVLRTWDWQMADRRKEP